MIGALNEVPSISWKAFLLVLLAGPLTLAAQIYPPPPVVPDGTVLLLTNYASLPISSRGGSLTNTPPEPILNNQLGRVNFLRSEPADCPLADTRFFVNDLNRNLYVLNRGDRAFTAYINFQAVFPKFDNDPGYAGGLVSFAFDPDYARNGRLYTVHTEDANLTGSGLPISTFLPGLDVSQYTNTPVRNPPVGPAPRQAVLVEWTDTDIENVVFEGSARELLRVGFNSNVHPMGDLIFNPLASPGSADYGNLYISMGDGAAGENGTSDDGIPGLTAGDRHHLPQRLDSLVGKILRITPDLARNPLDPLASNGCYRIPATGDDPNPFASLDGACGEIFAYGFRNPHRMSWDTVSGQLIVDDIGVASFEEINIVHKGDNHGYAEREGTRAFAPFSGNVGTIPPGAGLSELPDPDTLPWRVGTNVLANATAPKYPAAQYFQTEGDAIANGFVYRGALMPLMRGKYVFGDITTARLFYCDLEAMLAADDTDPATLADVHEIEVVFDTPEDQPDQGPARSRLFDIVADEYTRKGGKAPNEARLPGFAAVTSTNDAAGVPYGGGRADIRMALGGDGELYVLSKSDGMIRLLVGVLSPPVVESSVTADGVNLAWTAVPGCKYRVQFKSALDHEEWTALGEEILATNCRESFTDPPGESTRYYRIVEMAR